MSHSVAWDVVTSVDASSDDLPSLEVALSGTMRVGGSSGFVASVSASLETGASSGSLELQHDGGWSPLGGDLSSAFTTPAFAASVDVNVDGTYLRVAGSASWDSEISLVPNFITFVAHPSDADASGPSVQIELVRPTEDGDVSYDVQFETGLQLGAVGGLPVLSVSGDVGSSSSTLALSLGEFTPFPALLPNARRA